MIFTINNDNFRPLCNQLAAADLCLYNILQQYGYPPMWSRTPNFETLVHIILEQQVSLVSAKAALTKLQEKIGLVEPKALLALTDDELKACYFSRQKTGYARHLATSIITGQLILADLPTLPDDEIRHRLKQLKGIGNWTVDVFLMMALQRADCFPIGDIALINSIRYELKNTALSKEEILDVSEKWKPHRTVAAFMFWHAYLCRKDAKYKVAYANK